MTVRRSEWNRSKLHRGSVGGLIISNIPYCDDAAIEESRLKCAVLREYKGSGETFNSFTSGFHFLSSFAQTICKCAVLINVNTAAKLHLECTVMPHRYHVCSEMHRAVK